MISSRNLILGHNIYLDFFKYTNFHILAGEWDFSLGNWNKLVTFLGLCNFRDPLFTSRINGYRRMVIALNIQLTLCTIFLKGLVEGDSSSLYNTFWKIKGFPLAHIVAWRVPDNKITNKVNLARCEVAVNSMLCCFCREKEETTSHLFFECKITWLVWNLWYGWVGLKSTDHLESASHFFHFNLFGAPTNFNLVFGNIWIILVREISIFLRGQWLIILKFSSWLNWRSDLGLLPKFL